MKSKIVVIILGAIFISFGAIVFLINRATRVNNKELAWNTTDVSIEKTINDGINKEIIEEGSKDCLSDDEIIVNGECLPKENLNLEKKKDIEPEKPIQKVSEVYQNEVAVNAIKQETPKEIDYSCLLTNGMTVFCGNNQECVNNKCVLKAQTKKMGVIYLYESDKTHNFSWRSDMEKNLSKVQKALLEITNNKINYSLDVLGEIKSEEFCWNPAIVGVEVAKILKKVDLSTNETVSEESIHTKSPLPGSDLGTKTLVINSTKKKIREGDRDYLVIEEIGDIKLDCPHCFISHEDRTEEFQELFPNENFIEVLSTYVTIDCKNNFVDNKFNQDLIDSLKVRASKVLNFTISDYDQLILVFGNSGKILPAESNTNLEFRCKTAIGFVGGYSNLIFSENGIRSGGFVNCVDYTNSVWYEPTGWHIFLHEFLHLVGAVDLYDTGTVFGYDSPARNRAEALKVDPRTDESVMGDSLRECRKRAWETKIDECSESELERVYLDKYNKDKIGIF